MKSRTNSYTLTSSDFLTSVPVQNSKVTVEFENENEIVLAIPIRQKWYMKPPLSLILPFSKLRRVGLDKFGKEVWGFCDGKKCAENIIDSFATKYKLSFHEARISIMHFLRDLTERGLIVMVGKGKQQ